MTVMESVMIHSEMLTLLASFALTRFYECVHIYAQLELRMDPVSL